VGAVYPSRPLAISAEEVVRRHLTICGVHNYHPRDLATALAFLAEAHQRHPFAELVGRAFALEEADTAFAAATGKAVRVAVVPGP
jgi:hypothetical protein